MANEVNYGWKKAGAANKFTVTEGEWEMFRDWVRKTKHLDYLSSGRHIVELFLEWRSQ